VSYQPRHRRVTVFSAPMEAIASANDKTAAAKVLSEEHSDEFTGSQKGSFAFWAAIGDWGVFWGSPRLDKQMG